MNDRADPLGLDLSSFAGKKPQAKPSAADIRKVAEKASFPSREAVAPEAAPTPAPSAERRTYRTGRNAQFSCKVTKETQDDIYKLTDELTRRMAEQVPGARWTVAMTVERMVQALRRELEE